MSKKITLTAPEVGRINSDPKVGELAVIVEKTCRALTLVYIVDGAMYKEGRLSNTWHVRDVYEDLTLGPMYGHFYQDFFTYLGDVRVETTVRLMRASTGQGNQSRQLFEEGHSDEMSRKFSRSSQPDTVRLALELAKWRACYEVQEFPCPADCKFKEIKHHHYIGVVSEGRPVT